MTMRALGRIAKPDDRDSLYRLAPRSTTKLVKHWSDYGWKADQIGPSCVGYGFAMKLSGAPFRQFINALGIYRFARLVDDIPGEDYEGTTVRGGAKVLLELGFIEKFLWTWRVQDLAVAVAEDGSMVCGTEWLRKMWEPDDNGYIHADGKSDGGHCFLVDGVDFRRKRFRGKCAWGDWGFDGRGHFYLTFDDMQILLDMGGEACLAVEHKPHT